MNKKQIVLVIYPTFSEFEITVTTAILKNHFEIVTAAPTLKPLVSESGLTILPHMTFEEIDTIQYDGIIISGGDLFHIKDCFALFNNVEAFDAQRKFVAAICSGPYVLARAGVLNDKEYTATLSKKQRDFLGTFNEEQYIYEKVVVHNNVITAQGHAYVEFGLQIAKWLGVYKDEYEEFYSGRRNRLMEDN